MSAAALPYLGHPLPTTFPRIARSHHEAMGNDSFQIIVSVITNLTTSAVVLLVYSGAGRWTDLLSQNTRRALTGLVFGIAASLSMHTPIQVGDGMIIYGGGASMGLSGLFGGWIGGTIAAALGVAARLQMGGAGAVAGSLNLVIAAAIGVGMSLLVARTTGTVRFGHLAVQGVLLVFSAYGTVLMLPGDLREIMFRRVGIPMAVIFPLGTLFLGGLFSLDERRRDAARRLQESERRFRTIVNNVPGFVYQVRRSPKTMKTHHEFVSQGIHEIYGYSAEDALADPSLVERAFFPEEMPGRVESIRRSMEDLSVWSRDLRIRHRDGSVRWIRGKAVPHRLPNGDVVWDGVSMDVTQEKQREAELQQSRDLLDLVTQNIPGAIYRRIVGGPSDSPYLFFAGRILERFNLSTEEVIQTPGIMIKLVHPDDVPEVLKSLDPDGDDLRPRHFRFRAVTPDGETRHIEIQSRAERRNDGITVRNGMMLDVTDVAKAEAALAASELRFRGLVANLPGAVYQAKVGPDGKLIYTYISDRVKQILGVTGDVAVANPPLIQAAYFLEEEAERLRCQTEAIATMSPLVRDFRIRSADGNVRWVRSYSTPHRDERGDVFFDGFTVDITGNKRQQEELRRAYDLLAESDQRFHAIVENIPGAVFQARRSVDGKLTYPYMSAGVEELYGVSATKAQADPGLILRANFPDDEEERIRSLETSRDNLTLRVRDYRIRHTDGSIRWIQARSVPRREPNGDTVWYGMMTDITALKRAEEESHRTERMHALGQLTDGVAHEFNNLLTIVAGNTEFLGLELSGSAQVKESLAQIDRAVERGSRLTQELRSFAQKQSLTPQSENVNAALEEMSPLLMSALGSGAQLAFQPEPSLWPVHVDVHRLQTAVLNLVLNARDAIGDEGIISVVTGNSALDGTHAQSLGLTPGRYIRIDVRDNGRGMVPEVRERAVEPFFTTKEIGQGSGMGLSMVHGFVRQSGGNLDIASTPGKGTVVSLFLPAWDDAPEPGRTAAVS